MEPLGATSPTGVRSKGQLDFHKAMQDFKHMFPAMDAEVIEAVLRANDGLVDVTVDQLIAMASGESTDTTDLSQPQHSKRQVHRSCVQSRWRPPMLSPLPDDFLRLDVPTSASVSGGGGGGGRSPRPAGTGTSSPRPPAPALSSAGLHQRLEENRRQRAALGAEPPPDVAQYLEDERIALMLQNDEFMSELRRNRDFMDALEIDTPPLGLEPTWRDYECLDEDEQRPAGGPAHAHPHKTTYPDDEAFKERLKYMGKASRKKFAQLARLFHFSRRGGARAMLGHGPVPSGDQLLLNDDPLLPEDVEDEPPTRAAAHRPAFEDRHTVEMSSSSRDSGDRSPRHRDQNQLV